MKRHYIHFSWIRALFIIQLNHLRPILCVVQKRSNNRASVEPFGNCKPHRAFKRLACRFITSKLLAQNFKIDTIAFLITAASSLAQDSQALCYRLAHMLHQTAQLMQPLLCAACKRTDRTRLPFQLLQKPGAAAGTRARPLIFFSFQYEKVKV